MTYGVVDVSGVVGEEGGHVLPARLPVGRIKDTVLFLSALHLDVPDGKDEETAEEVVERVEVVQPVT
jgi:hypothetical protein